MAIKELDAPDGNFRIWRQDKTQFSPWENRTCDAPTGDLVKCEVWEPIAGTESATEIAFATLDGTIYAAWTTPSGLMVARSEDGAYSFGPPLLVSDKAAGPPAMAVMERTRYIEQYVGGQVLIVFRDKNDDVRILGVSSRQFARAQEDGLRNFVRAVPVHLLDDPGQAIMGSQPSVAALQDGPNGTATAIVSAGFVPARRGTLCPANLVAIRGFDLGGITYDFWNEVRIDHADFNITDGILAPNPNCLLNPVVRPVSTSDSSGRIVMAWSTPEGVQVSVSDKTATRFAAPFRVSDPGNAPFIGLGRPSLFQYDGSVAVAWVGGEFSVNIEPKVVEVADSRRPIVFLPGMMGSYLREGGDELWIGSPTTDRERLHNVPIPAGGYRSKYRGVYASSIIIRDNVLNQQVSDSFTSWHCVTNPLWCIGVAVVAPLVTGAFDIDTSVIVYEPTINHLTTRSGLRLYDGAGDPNRLTTSGCDMAQAASKPQLFAFPYDWRQDIAETSKKLKDFIGCVRRIHPDTDVDILAHSMGGLLARRYVIENPDHHVAHIATVGTPFLGAAKFPYVAFSGDFENLPKILQSHKETRDMVKYFPGAHQLMPSPAYYGMIGGKADKRYWSDSPWPFAENGWDLNGDGESQGVDESGKATTLPYYTFSEFQSTVDAQFISDAHPVANASAFHQYPGQDDWTHDTSGVKYLHFVGIEKRAKTIEQTTVETALKCDTKGISGPTHCVESRRISYVRGPGDGTVPVLSASRMGGQFGSGYENGLPNLDFPPIGPDNLNAPNAKFRFRLGWQDEEASHTGMIQDPEVLDLALAFFAADGGPAAPLAIETTSHALSENTSQQGYQKSLDLRLDGFLKATLVDEQGRKLDLTTGIPEGAYPPPFAEVSGFLNGGNALQISLPSDRGYQLFVYADGTPAAITTTLGYPGQPEQLVRYIDLPLTDGEPGKISISPGDSPTFSRDENRDGVFESPTLPRVTASGTEALDSTGPAIGILREPDDRRISILARDPAGTPELLYSYGDDDYFDYIRPVRPELFFDASVSIVARDGVANRSSRSTATFFVSSSYRPSMQSLPAMPVRFSQAVQVYLPEAATVSRGNIGTGAAHIALETADGTSITCTYRGRGSANPQGWYDVEAGKRIGFVGCTDGSSTQTRFSVRSIALQIETSDWLEETTRIDALFTGDAENGPVPFVAAPADKAVFGVADTIPVSVTVPADAQGQLPEMTVTIDGRPTSATAAIAAVDLLPGPHRLVVRTVNERASGRITDRVFEVRATIDGLIRLFDNANATGAFRDKQPFQQLRRKLDVIRKNPGNAARPLLELVIGGLTEELGRSCTGAAFRLAGRKCSSLDPIWGRKLLAVASDIQATNNIPASRFVALAPIVSVWRYFNRGMVDGFMVVSQYDRVRRKMGLAIQSAINGHSLIELGILDSVLSEVTDNCFVWGAGAPTDFERSAMAMLAETIFNRALIGHDMDQRVDGVYALLQDVVGAFEDQDIQNAELFDSLRRSLTVAGRAIGDRNTFVGRAAIRAFVERLEEATGIEDRTLEQLLDAANAVEEAL